MMYKARSGESKDGEDRNVVGSERKDKRRTFQRNDCSELAVLQAEAMASLRVEE